MDELVLLSSLVQFCCWSIVLLGTHMQKNKWCLVFCCFVISSSPADPRQSAYYRYPAEDKLQVWVRDERRNVSEGKDECFQAFYSTESGGLDHHALMQNDVNVCVRVFSKGKGTETTYWLTGETGEDYDLPTPPTT